MEPIKARKLTLPVFKKIKFCDSTEIGAILFAGQEQLHFRLEIRPSLTTDELVPVQCNLFPVVITASGSIWEPAHLYLAHRVFSLGEIEMKTHHNVADDLARYKQYLDEKTLDFDDFDSESSYEFPTYRYRNALQKQFERGEIAASTAKRRMQSVVTFYRYLIEKGILSPKNRPWINKTIAIHIKDEKGFARTRTVETTDLRIRANQQEDPWHGSIEDGGKLKPLTWDDQITLITGLMKWANPEMLLIHLIALFTGARIQTILTLRIGHFVDELRAGALEVTLKVGRGTDVDTKAGKICFLVIPLWLYDKLRIYNRCERAQKRRRRAGKETPDQYFFLSKVGKPYYTSKEDCRKFDPNRKTKTDSNGQEVRKFKKGLIERIVQHTGKPAFYYRIHDLRATFGMNLTDAQLKLVEEGKITLSAAREYVKFRMGHANYAVTDRYLSFRSNQEFIRNVRDAYGEHLDQLREIVIGQLV